VKIEEIGYVQRKKSSEYKKEIRRQVRALKKLCKQNKYNKDKEYSSISKQTMIVAKRKHIFYTMMYCGITYHYKTVIMGCGKSDSQIRKQIKEEMYKSPNRIKQMKIEQKEIKYNKVVKVEKDFLNILNQSVTTYDFNRHRFNGVVKYNNEKEKTKKES